MVLAGVRSVREVLRLVAVDLANKVMLVISLAKRSNVDFIRETDWLRGPGSPGLQRIPLVVIVLCTPKVNSVPNVTGRKVHAVAVAASNSESVSALASLSGLDLPLLAARVVVTAPEVNVGLVAARSN